MMKRRLFSLCLAAALLFSLLPAVAQPMQVSAATTQVSTYFRDSSVVIDGQKDAIWERFTNLTSCGTFSTLFDKEHIYLAIVPQAGVQRQLGIKLGGKVFVAQGNNLYPSTDGVNASSATAVDGSAAFFGDSLWEVRIPFAVMDGFETSWVQYGKTFTLSVRIGGGWQDYSLLCTNEPTENLTVFGTLQDAGQCAGDNTSGIYITGNDVHMRLSHQGVTDTATLNHWRRIYVDAPTATAVGTNTQALEFDFTPTSMPEMRYYNANFASTCIGNGFNLHYQMGAAVNGTVNEGYSIGIINLNGALTFLVRTTDADTQSAKAITIAQSGWQNKAVHIRMEYTPTTKVLNVWADGVHLGTFSSRTVPLSAEGKVLISVFNSNQLSADAPAMDFRVDNLTSGISSAAAAVAPSLVQALENDTAPNVSNGTVLTGDTMVLNKTNNSIVRDFVEQKLFNVVQLVDSDTTATLRKENISLWISNDNKTYQKVSDFKLTHEGNLWHLYDFEAKAQYVKVHYNHKDSDSANLTLSLTDGIKIFYQPVIAPSAGMVSKTVTYTNTTGKDLKDTLVSISKAANGITGDDRAIRVMQGTRYLYHYVGGDNINIRVPDMAAGETITLTIHYGETGLLDIANKEAALEVTYGDKESYVPTVKWMLSVPAGVYANGIVEQDMIIGNYGKRVSVSFDGGYTYLTRSHFPTAVTDMANNAFYGDGGWVLDEHTGRIFFLTWRIEGKNANAYNVVLYSDDFGYTWNVANKSTNNVVAPLAKDTIHYSLTYSDGIQTSVYDGEGPNVDFVYPAGIAATETADATYGTIYSFKCAVIYSTDGGLTWQFSPNLLTTGNASTASEAGVSEGWIMENENGVLVLYARNQGEGNVHFAYCYSYDFGKSWTSQSKANWQANPETGDVQGKLSSIYASNTQPSMEKFVQSNGSEAPLMYWGGNNILKDNEIRVPGVSYMRHPFNVAISYDGLESWQNIQNIFGGMYMENFIKQNAVVNQSLVQVGGDLQAAFFSANSTQTANEPMGMRVSDYENWFYRTKGAYDGFELGSLGYEGWNALHRPWDEEAELLVTTEKYATGRYSMRMRSGTYASRTIPSVTNGRITFSVYKAAGSDLHVALQKTLSNDIDNTDGLAAKLVITQSSITCGSVSIGLNQNQWNLVEIDLTSKTMRVNSGTAKSISINVSATAPICFVTMFNKDTSSNYYNYIDDFTVVDNDVVQVYTQPGKAFVAQVGSTGYESVDEAMQKANGQTVKLLSNCATYATISSDVYLDLNGKTLSGQISGSGSPTLYCIDTTNDDYNGTGKLAATADSNVKIATQAVVDGKKYMRIGSAGNYSFHRYELLVTAGLAANCSINGVAAPGMKFTYTFIADAVARAAVSKHGVAVALDRDGVLTKDAVLAMTQKADFFGQGEFTDNMISLEYFSANTVVSGILRGDKSTYANKKSLDATVWGKAYVELSDGTVIFSDNCDGGTMRTLIQKTDDLWDAGQLDVAEQTAIKWLYRSFKEVVKTVDVNADHIPNSDIVVIAKK